MSGHLDLKEDFIVYFRDEDYKDRMEMVYISLDRNGTCLMRIRNDRRDLSIDPVEVRYFESGHQLGSHYLLSIYFGSEFVLKKIDLGHEKLDNLIALQKEIEIVRELLLEGPYNTAFSVFLKRHFSSLQVPGRDIIALENWVSFMTSATGLSNEKILEYVDNMTSVIDWTTFFNVFRKIMNVESKMSKALRGQFYKSCKTKEKAHFGVMGASDFKEFLLQEQKEDPSDNICLQMLTYISRITSNRLSQRDPKLGFEDFLDYLFSPHNSLLLVEESEMNHPLAKYFINSSHNTYLHGHQFFGTSDARNYARLLLLGVRCIEIDCWNGYSDDFPISVTHGNTLCTKVDFLSVIRTIREHAFATSPYPVIISIENHCSTSRQKLMADILTNELKDYLLREPCDNGRDLPSPSDLKYKIILKHKKFTEDPSDPNEAIVCGELYFLDCQRKEWTKSFATLQNGLLKMVLDTNDMVDFAMSGSEMELAMSSVQLPFSEKKVDSCLRVKTSSGSTFLLATRERNDIWKKWATSFIAIPSPVPLLNRRTSSQGSRLNGKFCPELLDLIVYCRTSNIPDDLRDLPYTDMISLDENKAKAVLVNGVNRSKVLDFQTSRLARVYPRASRIDSSNFHPLNSHLWSSGSQMLALNFQTPGDEIQVNQAWFSLNGSKGYLLKPKALRQNVCDPITAMMIPEESMELDISIICGRALSPKKPLLSVYVQVEVLGCSILDCIYGATKISANNSLNPVWDEAFQFGIIQLPSMACIRFAVYTDKNRLLGQAIVPMKGIREGYRSVALTNYLGEKTNNLSTLLLHVAKRPILKYKKDFVSDLWRKLKDLILERDQVKGNEKELLVLDSSICNIRQQLEHFLNRKTFTPGDSYSFSSELRPSETTSPPVRRSVSSIPFLVELGYQSTTTSNKMTYQSGSDCGSKNEGGCRSGFRSSSRSSSSSPSETRRDSEDAAAATAATADA